MTNSKQWTIEQIERLPPTALEYELLHRIPDHEPVRRDHLIAKLLGEAAPTAPVGQITYNTSDGRIHANPKAAMALAEAWQRLVLDGLIVDWPPKDPRYNTEGHGEMFQLTRWGREIRDHGTEGSRLVSARRRLGVELHPQLAGRLRDVVAVGAFEQAALLALRAVESRVRILAGDPRGKRGERLTGTTLMQSVFSSENGPLADSDAEPGERVGIMNLFAGAFGAVRNGLVHTEVEWADPTEAAEYVLLADLLMRLLDRAEQRASP